jgi:UDP-N-acetylmuramoyl-tripeptide--D-alanyl-D-alanine ligase
VEELIGVVGPILEADDLVLVKASRAAYLDKFVKAVTA